MKHFGGEFLTRPQGKCATPFKVKSSDEIDLPQKAFDPETTLKKSKCFKVYFRALFKRKTCFMVMP